MVFESKKDKGIVWSFIGSFIGALDISPKDVEGFKTGLIMAIKKYKETLSTSTQ